MVGENQYGQLGLGDLSDRHTPVEATAFGSDNVAIALGLGMYALKANGTIWSAGYNGQGQLGAGGHLSEGHPNWGSLCGGG